MWKNYRNRNPFHLVSENLIQSKTSKGFDFVIGDSLKSTTNINSTFSFKTSHQIKCTKGSDADTQFKSYFPFEET